MKYCIIQPATWEGVQSGVCFTPGQGCYALRDSLFEVFPESKEIDLHLSGIGGLGKEKNDGRESFYLVLGARGSTLR